MDRRVKAALAIIESQLDKPLSVEDLSARFRLSRWRFEHLFKEGTGKSFTTYVHEARLKKEQDVLAHTTTRVKELADKMGYKQPRSLTREFKRHSGLSPRQYQKSQHVR